MDVNRRFKESVTKSLSVTLAFLLVSGARGQDGKKQPEPVSLSVLYYLDSDQLVALESQVLHVKHKPRSLGFAGGTTVYVVRGEKSPVRLKAEAKPEFVVRLQGDLDPLEAVQFFHFDLENGSRVMHVADFDPFGRVSKLLPNSTPTDFNAVKQGKSSVKLIPIQTLVPGEYCAMIVKPGQLSQSKTPVYCFGVDADGQKGSQ
jgi:hypothetical protein